MSSWESQFYTSVNPTDTCTHISLSLSLVNFSFNIAGDLLGSWWNQLPPRGRNNHQTFKGQTKTTSGRTWSCCQLETSQSACRPPRITAFLTSRKQTFGDFKLERRRPGYLNPSMSFTSKRNVFVNHAEGLLHRESSLFS